MLDYSDVNPDIMTCGWHSICNTCCCKGSFERYGVSQAHDSESPFAWNLQAGSVLSLWESGKDPCVLRFFGRFELLVCQGRSTPHDLMLTDGAPV